jgi:spore cortex biosynthesis protein YabQ
MILIVEQVYVFLYAILCGAIAAFFYDILRIKRRTVKTNVLFVALEDILYWLLAAIFLFITVYKSNSGEMRGYIFMGNIIGVMLYEALLSKIIISFSVTFINVTKRVVKFIFRILSYPFIIVYKLFKPPVRLVAKLMSAISKTVAGRVIIINRKISLQAKKQISKIKKKIGNKRKKHLK